MAGVYVVAVSGGVDSVVLLDKLMNDSVIWSDEHPRAKLIVAHFDHGIRPESAQDAEFVAGLAGQYGLEYRIAREELGAAASEELARNRRYAFLQSIAAEHNDACIVMAHHADDIAETIAINFQRGTEWRGLAVLDRPDVWRPLLGQRKRSLVAYAQHHDLQWHEDSTNTDQSYLRNRLRHRLATASDQSVEYFAELRLRQIEIRQQIDDEVRRLLPDGPDYPRHFFAMVDQNVAVELLRYLFSLHCGDGLTIKQRRQILQAIKVARLGARYEITSGVSLRFTRTNFIVEVTT